MSGTVHLILLYAFMVWVGTALRFTFTVIELIWVFTLLFFPTHFSFLQFPSLISIFFAPLLLLFVLLPSCLMFSAFLTTWFRIFLFLSPFSFLFCIDTFLISATRDMPDVADNNRNVLFAVGPPRVQQGAVLWLNSLCFCLPCQLLRQASVCIIVRALCWELFRSVTALCPALLTPPPPPFAVSFCSERYTEVPLPASLRMRISNTAALFICMSLYDILSRFSHLGLDSKGLLDTLLTSEFTGSFSPRLV